jgi:predicted aspartyl protease
MANPYFDSEGRPTIDIEVSNPIGWKASVTALIDTGFDGFLSLPILEAFPIGLLLRGMMPVTLADGSTQDNLFCLGRIEFDGEKRDGTILTDWQGSALFGMDFLRTFRRALLVNPVNQIITLRALR